MRDAGKLDIKSTLQEKLRKVVADCINCKFCQEECAFLRKYGKPKEIAEAYDPGDKVYQAMPFECSLCRLCAAVCPVNVNPAEMFLEMRREAACHGIADYPEHSVLLNYEKRGTSKRYTYYTLPEGCDTILFPGCTLPGTRPEKTLALYEHMKKTIPALGMVLDCCAKPSYDLGRQAYFHAMFQEMKDFLLQNGVRQVLVACPNCHKIFRTYGEPLAVRTVYEFLAESELPENGNAVGTVTVHDPCAVRYEPSIHAAVRELCAKRGLRVIEMSHHGAKALCCGEGGAVGLISPEFSKTWGELRQKETNGDLVITYCAGCANFLDPLTPTGHVLDLIFAPQALLDGNIKVSKAPFTYFNRLMLKRRLKKTVAASVARERTFTADEQGRRGGAVKRIALLLLILGAILAAHFTGEAHSLSPDTLKQWLQSYGALAPAIYMLVYIVAPALFLPGLPITMVGGILFGPAWGVVYTIISSTLGACVAFLISRYIARDWIERKLRSPKWQRLDQGVERHGWKVVAFSRLIPLFPYNLLNYAFGLTKIGFWQYALTTFICMLPACIAYIIFSSSLLDLFRGKVSAKFVIGLGLIVLLSVLPYYYHKYKNSKWKDTPI
jgi:uncharacterized membrane protein YdjX (TVP38/TMEM64 family)/Fe-S oxidoreductase